MEVVTGPDSILDQALCRLVDQYQTALLRMCYMYLHDTALAEDAVQETFLKAYKAMASFRGDCSEIAWLMRIAMNTCRDMQRSAWFRRVDRRITPDLLPEASVPFEESDEEVTLAVMKLPKKLKEVIMALAKSEFGPVYDQWTLEQQYWFGEVMVAIGFRETNPARLPGEGEISLDQATAILKARILEEYSDDLSDTATWVRYATYGVGVNGEGEVVSPASWFFQFQPTDVKHNEYMLTMDSTGKITSMDVREAPEGGYGADVIRQYQAVYGGFRDWTPEVWAALGKDLKGLSPLTLTAWAFQNAGYILPPEGGITFEQAGETALANVHLDYTTVSGGVCCMAGDKAIWKIETHTMRPEDIGSGKYTAIWLVEIDCMAGNVLEKREFVVGSDVGPLTRWIP